MNDFPENSAIGEAVLYADDSTEIIVKEDPNVLESKLQMQASLIFNSKLSIQIFCGLFSVAVNPDITDINGQIIKLLAG